MSPSARRKLDIDRRIVRNREEADRLEQVRSTIRFTREQANDSLRNHKVKDTPDSFESPDSQTIVGASYDADTRTLSITFKRASLIGGKLPTYFYTGVSPELWEQFYHAESKGQFFAASIRPKFLGRERDKAASAT